MALIDAVMGDERADPTLKRLAALARSELKAHPDMGGPSLEDVPAQAQPPVVHNTAFQAHADPTLFSLGSTDSPRLPVSVAAQTSAGGGHQVGAPGGTNPNMMHPY